jgi:hypothetical protein
MGTQGPDALWWHELLLRHPQVSGPPEPLQFFTRFCEREMTGADVARYHGHFAGPVSGEWTPRYLSDPWTPRLLARAAPDAKVIVLLADPVERYRQRLGRALAAGAAEDQSVHVADGLSDVIAHGRYATQLRTLFDHIDPERTLVLQDERCRRDLGGEYRRTLRFLGVPERRPRRRRGSLRGRLARARVKQRARGVELWPEIEQVLRDELGPEMAELQALVPDLQLDLWQGAGT